MVALPRRHRQEKPPRLLKPQLKLRLLKVRQPKLQLMLTTEAAAPADGGCTDPLGCVTIAAGEPIKIAYAMVTSGPNGSLGIDSERGMEIAVEDMGGELLGHPIEIVGEDTGCSPEGGQAAASKLASDTSLFAVVGTTCSSEARVGAPIITGAGMSMISPSNTAPDLTDPAKHVAGYFRTAHNDKVQGRVAAEFVYNDLGLKKAATIHDGSVYAQGLVNCFCRELQGAGWRDRLRAGRQRRRH